MKILQVAPNYSPRMGGIVNVVGNISNELTRKGHEVVLLTTDYYIEEAELDEDFSIVVFRNWFKSFNFYVSPGMLIWMLRNLSAFDVIHLHGARTFQNILMVYGARFLHIPYVLTTHGTIHIVDRLMGFKKVYDFLFGNRMIKNAAHLFAVSQQEVQEILKWGIAESNISLAYNGHDWTHFNALPRKGEFRERHGVPGNAKLVLGLGRIHRNKGFDLLLECFEMVLKKFENSVLAIVGPDEGALGELKEGAKSLGISDKVIFPGPLYGREKLGAYNDANVFAHSPRFEPFGLVVFEALMCETPVVLSDRVGAGEVIQELDVGYITPFGDTEAMANSILRVLSAESEMVENVIKAKPYLADTFSWANVTEKIEGVYYQVRSGKSVMTQDAGSSD